MDENKYRQLHIEICMQCHLNPCRADCTECFEYENCTLWDNFDSTDSCEKCEFFPTWEQSKEMIVSRLEADLVYFKSKRFHEKVIDNINKQIENIKERPFMPIFFKKWLDNIPTEEATELYSYLVNNPRSFNEIHGFIAHNHDVF